MKNYKFADIFFEKNKERIFNLLKCYQMIEVLLFLKLHLPDSSHKDNLDELNKKFNSKTLGRLSKVYSSKYPDDKQKIKNILEKVIPQRNDFVHAFWFWLSLVKSEEDVFRAGAKRLTGYTKNASKLLDKIINFKE